MHTMFIVHCLLRPLHCLTSNYSKEKPNGKPAQCIPLTLKIDICEGKHTGRKSCLGEETSTGHSQYTLVCGGE